MGCGSSKYTVAALELFRSQMGDERIVAIIISHVHVDHYGVIEGLIDYEDVADLSLPLEQQIASGKTAVIVPQGEDAVMKENVFVGAAVYKFIHDQTLLYINQGYTSTRIASMIRLPEALEKIWYTRQYYGTLKHNVRAIYQKYMGWYDAEPIHLDKLEPSEYAKKLTEYLGDAQTMLDYMGIMMDSEKLADCSFTVKLIISTSCAGILAIANNSGEDIERLVKLENGAETLFKVLCSGMAKAIFIFNIIES